MRQSARSPGSFAWPKKKLLKFPVALGHFALDLDLNTEGAEPAKKPIGQMLFVVLREILTTQVVKLDAVAEHVVDVGQHGGRHRENRLLGAPTALQPEELGVKIAVLLASGGPRPLHERGLQPRRPRARPRGAPLAGAFIQSRAQPTPGEEMAGAGKLRHVVADLGHDDGSRRVTQARHRHQEVDGGAKGREGLPDTRLQVGDGGLQRSDLREMELDHESMMRRDPALQRGDELRPRRLEPSVREIGQPLRLGLPCDERGQNRPAADAKDIAHDLRQLEIRVFERLLDALRVPDDLAHQLLPRSGEIAQFLDRRRRDEATPDEPQRQQVGDPRRIVLVALPTRDIADVHRIGQDERQVIFEHMPHGLPVDAGRFHRDMGALVGRQPLGQLQQPAGGRRDRAVLIGHRRARRDAHTRDNGRRVDIQTSAARIQHLHQPPPFRSGAGVESPDAKSKRCARQRSAAVAIRGARGTPGQTTVRAPSTNAKPTSVPTPRDTVPRFMTTRVRRRRVGNYCGTVTLHDEQGAALHTIRYGCMPEGDLPGLRNRLVADVATLVSKQPRVRIQLLCDGAPEMWSLLDDGFTREKFGDRLHELVDLYHLMEKLAPAAHVLDGDTVAKTLGAWKLALLNRPQAATRIRMELELSGKEHVTVGKEQPVHAAMTYLTSHSADADRMNYARARRLGLPLGSGNVEATCKRLFEQRLKRCGARWKTDTGEHIVSLRALALSDRWGPAIQLTLRPLRKAVRPAA